MRRSGGVDYRLPALGASAWLAALTADRLLVAGSVLVWASVLLACASLGVVTLLLPARRVVRTTALTALVLFAAVAGESTLRADQIGHSPVAELAAQGAEVRVTATVASDPRLVGQYEPEEMVQLDILEITGRGRTYRLHAPVLAMGNDLWASVALGSRISTWGRLQPATGSDVAALLQADEGPHVIADPGLLWRATARLRAALRDSVAGRPPVERALVPALVDGDSATLDPTIAADFRTTGLTHLLAVSGTNLTLVMGFLLLSARWCGVRGRWLYVVGLAGIGGFVLLARAEPSVLRAAVMGAVGLVSLDGRPRALRCLGFAVLILMLLDPALAVSAGFALSTLATAGIVLLAPLWRDALATWMPRRVAEAIAVPATAQLSCTPLIAAISGQVSVVAVVANLLAEPVVAPATVLGLLGGVAQLLCPPVGAVFGLLASWCVGWIVIVAEHCAALPTAAVPWTATAFSLVLLSGLTAAVAFGAPAVLRNRLAGPVCCALLVMVLVTGR